jgi:hypothetical protein
VEPFVDEEELPVGVGLRDDALDRLSKERLGVVERDDD